MQGQDRLTLRAFDRHEPHRRTRYRLADRFSVSRIVFLAAEVGLYITRRHQPNLVAQGREFTGPIMGGGARFHADQARG